MISAIVAIPATIGQLGVPTYLESFEFGQGCTVHLPATAAAGDAVSFYGGDIGNATSIDQLAPIVALSIPAPGQTGQQPSPVAPLTASYLYVYAVRTAGSSGALSAVLVGQETTGTSSGSPVAAAQAVWYIDGQNTTGKANNSNDGKTALTPLLTDSERARRVGAQPVGVAMTVYLLSRLQSTDYITEPLMLLSGVFTVDASQGATVLHTGVLTSYSAQSGNNPVAITDSGVDWTTGGPGGTSLIGFRLRVTSGANMGAISWLLHDNGEGQAVVTDPEIFSTSPTQQQLVSVSLSAGDHYVIESLPSIPAVVSPYDGAADGYNSDNAVVRFMYASATFQQFAYSFDCAPNDNFQRQFVGCSMGSMFTNAMFMACLWPIPDGAVSLQVQSGITPYLLGCGVMGNGDPAFTIGRGAAVTFDQGTTIYGASLLVNGWAGIGVDDVGTFIGGSTGVVAATGDAVIVEPGGDMRATYPLWGSGSGGYGVRAQSAGLCVYGDKPTITGTTGNAIVGGTPKAWTSIPFSNTANLSAIVALA